MDANTLYYGDCLDWMGRWDDKSVDLIYLDPPFNSKANYNVLYSNDGAGGFFLSQGSLRPAAGPPRALVATIPGALCSSMSHSDSATLTTSGRQGGQRQARREGRQRHAQSHAQMPGQWVWPRGRPSLRDAGALLALLQESEGRVVAEELFCEVSPALRGGNRAPERHREPLRPSN